MAPINRITAQRQTPLKKSGANATMIGVKADGKLSIKHSVESLFYDTLPLAFTSSPILLTLTLAQGIVQSAACAALQNLEKVELRV